MSVRIQLNNPSRNHYTNLDYISGRVILSCQHEEQVTAVVVKLEGESFTQLARPDPFTDYKNNLNRRDRDRWCREVHKILYKKDQVFPTHVGCNTVDNALLGVGVNYTLPPGQHTWPFRFRLPVNNVCANPDMQGVGASLNFGGLSLSELPGQLAYRHVVNTLPPTMTGFSEEAEIRYFVKVTVQRPGFFRENRRSQVPFLFMPVEPPRPALTGQEAYARRTHTFEKGPAPHSIKRKPSLFNRETPNSSLSDTPPSISIDARLPNPAILTCMRPTPLRLLVKKQAESPEHVYLTNLQVELLCSTTIRAQEAEQTRQRAWIIMTKANMHMPVSKPDDQIGDEMVVDGSGLWDTVPLPQGVLPTFQTCNLNRQYILEIKVGLGYGDAGGDVNPQSIVHLPLRFPVQVFSGNAPPPELLQGARPPSQGVPLSANRPAPTASSRPPDLPTRPVASVSYDPAYPPQLKLGDLADDDDAPPPSYADAIAEGSPIQADGAGVGPNIFDNLTAGSGISSTAPAGSSTSEGMGGAFGSRADG